jgi:hypothetical protein
MSQMNRLLCSLLIAAILSVCFIHSVDAASFKGRAVGLDRKADGVDRDNIPNVTVQIIAGGVVRAEQTFPDGNFTISAADNLLAGFDSVSLFFSSPGRDSVTLDAIFGFGDQTVNVVMPKQGEQLCPTCPPVRHGFFHWFRK